MRPAQHETDSGREKLRANHNMQGSNLGRSHCKTHLQQAFLLWAGLFWMNSGCKLGSENEPDPTYLRPLGSEEKSNNSTLVNEMLESASIFAGNSMLKFVPQTLKKFPSIPQGAHIILAHDLNFNIEQSSAPPSMYLIIAETSFALEYNLGKPARHRGYDSRSKPAVQPGDQTDRFRNVTTSITNNSQNPAAAGMSRALKDVGRSYVQGLVAYLSQKAGLLPQEKDAGLLVWVEGANKDSKVIENELLADVPAFPVKVKPLDAPEDFSKEPLADTLARIGKLQESDPRRREVLQKVVGRLQEGVSNEERGATIVTALFKEMYPENSINMSSPGELENDVASVLNLTSQPLIFGAFRQLIPESKVSDQKNPVLLPKDSEANTASTITLKKDASGTVEQISVSVLFQAPMVAVGNNSGSQIPDFQISAQLEVVIKRGANGRFVVPDNVTFKFSGGPDFARNLGLYELRGQGVPVSSSLTWLPLVGNLIWAQRIGEARSQAGNSLKVVSSFGPKVMTMKTQILSIPANSLVVRVDPEISYIVGITTEVQTVDTFTVALIHDLSP